MSGVQEARQLIPFHSENSSTAQAHFVWAEADREGSYSIVLLLRSDPLLCASTMLRLDVVCLRRGTDDGEANCRQKNSS